MAAPTAWLYVNERRTHELRVSIERERQLRLVIRESAFGGSHASEVYTETHTLGEPWEQKLQLLALETRLAMLGNYLKGGSDGWTPVRVAQTGDKFDLAPLEFEEGSDAVEFHHFSGEGTRAASLVGVHQDTDAGRRSLLVRLDHRLVDAKGGKLTVIHPRLTPLLYRSALASAHLALKEKGYQKIARGARHMVDPKSWEAIRDARDDILARLVSEASARIDNMTDGRGRPLDAGQFTLTQEAVKAAKGAASAKRTYELENEMDLAATSVDGKKPERLIEELSPDIVGALNEPRLLALHERFMPGDAQRHLFARGERAIGTAMRDLRNVVRPDERHLVSLLEASLLLRYAFTNRIPVDPDVIKRVKHARAYL